MAKLLNIVQPDIVYLGQKDAQQAEIIRRMVHDLNFPVKVKVMPTVREKTGLALSSRNVYLNAQEKKDALALSKSLKLAALLIRGGLRDPLRISRRMRELIRKKKAAKIEYISIVDPKNLLPVKKIKNASLIALAVRIGKTRLIDSALIRV
jgi:pantoate--beta-alanine ligase